MGGIIEVLECGLLQDSIERYTDPTGKYIMCSLFLNVYFVYKQMCGTFYIFCSSGVEEEIKYFCFFPNPNFLDPRSLGAFIKKT